MFCKVCGNWIKDSETVCSECGAAKETIESTTEFKWNLKDFPKPKDRGGVEVDWKSGILKDLETGRVYSQTENEWREAEVLSAIDPKRGGDDNTQTNESQFAFNTNVEKIQNVLDTEFDSITQTTNTDQKKKTSSFEKLDLFEHADDFSDLIDIEEDNIKKKTPSKPKESPQNDEQDEEDYRNVTMYPTSEGRYAMQIMSKEEEAAIAAEKEAARKARQEEIRLEREAIQKASEKRKQRNEEEKQIIKNVAGEREKTVADKNREAQKKFDELLHREREFDEKIERLSQKDFIYNHKPVSQQENTPFEPRASYDNDKEKKLADFERRSKISERKIFEAPPEIFNFEDFKHDSGFDLKKPNDVTFKTIDIQGYSQNIERPEQYDEQQIHHAEGREIADLDIDVSKPSQYNDTEKATKVFDLAAKSAFKIEPVQKVEESEDHKKASQDKLNQILKPFVVTQDIPNKESQTDSEKRITSQEDKQDKLQRYIGDKSKVSDAQEKDPISMGLSDRSSDRLFEMTPSQKNEKEAEKNAALEFEFAQSDEHQVSETERIAERISDRLNKKETEKNDNKNKEVEIKIEEPTGTRVTVKTQEIKLIPTQEMDRIKTREVSLEALRGGPKNVQVSVEVTAKKGQASVEVVRMHDGLTRVKTVEDGETKTDRVYSENENISAGLIFEHSDIHADESVNYTEEKNLSSKNLIFANPYDTAETAETDEMSDDAARSTESVSESEQTETPASVTERDIKSSAEHEIEHADERRYALPEEQNRELFVENEPNDSEDIVYQNIDEPESDMTTEEEFLNIESKRNDISDFSPTGPLGIVFEKVERNGMGLQEDQADKDIETIFKAKSPEESVIQESVLKNSENTEDDEDDEYDEYDEEGRGHSKFGIISKLLIAILLIILLAELSIVGIKMIAPDSAAAAKIETIERVVLERVNGTLNGN